jgi:hypothetical protein
MRNIVLAVVLLGGLVGCTSQPKPEIPKADVLAAGQLKTMERLVELFAKNPNNPEIFEGIEELRNTAFRPKESPDLAKKILDLYKEKIAGKYKSEFANQLAIEMKQFENQLK